MGTPGTADIDVRKLEIRAKHVPVLCVVRVACCVHGAGGPSGKVQFSGS